eukprot:TRINITY_DN4390_c1_g2_i2.p1 TRINITY_DN4390_c1_g2~~TRINITY_DN4390_c1_g2_i2.p1  ORF type:complete len:415 (-),score=95.42 TRINITY_DN4390_c1_g2_i2:135-1286(-)
MAPRIATLLATAIVSSVVAQIKHVPHEVSAAVDARNAAEAAEQAKNAAAHAQRVAEHSVDIAEKAHEALDHAHDVVRAARVGSRGLSTEQEDLLRKAEAKLRSAKKLAEYGGAVPVMNNASGASEVEGMEDDLGQLRKKLEATDGSMQDKSMEQMDKELHDLQGMLKKLEDEERRVRRSDPVAHRQLKVEIQHLREAMNRLNRFGKVTATLPNKVVRDPETGELRYRLPRAKNEPKVQLTPLVDLAMKSNLTMIGAAPAPAAAAAPPGITPLDVDTDMPYGEIEPFGRENTAQELTEASIRESNAMVDQLERAEIAEEKRAVFRALTRLRGAAIASFDGVARAQTMNIDEYNKVNKWRNSHPLNHLANEESDVSKWAFPNEAD